MEFFREEIRRENFSFFRSSTGIVLRRKRTGFPFQSFSAHPRKKGFPLQSGLEYRPFFLQKFIKI